MRATVLCISLAAALGGCAHSASAGCASAPRTPKSAPRCALFSRRAPHSELRTSISVQTVHGVVYLRGLVSTPYQIAEAGSIAEQAPGVTDVQNLLTIDNSR